MTVRWGIAGPGAIAGGLADDLARLGDAELVAVGSRSAERAAAFGDRFGIPKRHGSYEALAEDPEVDIVYVATPQSRHEPDTLLYLEADKHVLCEKPFALSAAQGRRMVDSAHRRGLFLMEAMWSRFLPPYRALVDVVGDGQIGDVLMVEADFGWRGDVDPAHRSFDRAMGGGALLDLGVYPVHLAQLLLGRPDGVAAAGHVGETGVDEAVAAVLHHDAGSIAVVKAALRISMTCTARITGTEGTIDLPAFMHCPGHLDISTPQGRERISTPWEGNGLRFQVEEVHRCLAEGHAQSPMMPLAGTLAVASTLDEVRSQLGVVYPHEQRT